MDLENRLRRLERTNRLLLVLLAITATTFVCAASDHGARLAQRPATIVADSVVTRSLAVVNPTGKQGLRIAVGDDGMVVLGITDAKGKETIGLISEPDANPTLCFAYRKVCRVVIGGVYRGLQPEMSVQLRDSLGHPIWMPGAANPLAGLRRGTSGQ
jgi:hypothetical protein